MTDAPIGQYIADLAKLLDQHPAPWRFHNDERDPSVRDANDTIVIDLIFEEDDDILAAGLVAAVILAAGIRP